MEQNVFYALSVRKIVQREHYKLEYKVGIRLYMGSEVAYDTRDISDTIHKLNEGIRREKNQEINHD